VLYGSLEKGAKKRKSELGRVMEGYKGCEHHCEVQGKG
jgi:hypothetical protein